jgi:hypothetical protein
MSMSASCPLLMLLDVQHVIPVDNMTEDRVEQHRAANRVDNLPQDRVEQHCAVNRVGGSLTAEFKE